MTFTASISILTSATKSKDLLHDYVKIKCFANSKLIDFISDVCYLLDLRKTLGFSYIMMCFILIRQNPNRPCHFCNNKGHLLNTLVAVEK